MSLHDSDAYDPENRFTRTTLLDCGDNSCAFVRPEARKGMRTNGGCRCLADYVPSKLASRINVTFQLAMRELREANANLALLRKEVALLHLSNNTERFNGLEAENAELRAMLDDVTKGHTQRGLSDYAGKLEYLAVEKMRLERENAELRDTSPTTVCMRCGKQVRAPGIHTCSSGKVSDPQ